MRVGSAGRAGTRWCSRRPRSPVLRPRDSVQHESLLVVEFEGVELGGEFVELFFGDLGAPARASPRRVVVVAPPVDVDASRLHRVRAVPQPRNAVVARTDVCPSGTMLVSRPAARAGWASRTFAAVAHNTAFTWKGRSSGCFERTARHATDVRGGVGVPRAVDATVVQPRDVDVDATRQETRWRLGVVVEAHRVGRHVARHAQHRCVHRREAGAGHVVRGGDDDGAAEVGLIAHLVERKRPVAPLVPSDRFTTSNPCSTAQPRPRRNAAALPVRPSPSTFTLVIRASARASG